MKKVGELISLPTCCSFTVPKIEYEEETMSYGNIEQVFLTPKYDSCKELTLEFFETYLTENDIFNSSVTLSRIFKYIDLTVNQKYIGILKQTNYADYQKHMINSIVVKIMDNKLQNYVYQYVFGNLKVVNYTIYNLDYQSDNPCKVSVTLSFETYEKGSIKEEINYGVTETQDTPPVNDKRDTVEETIENKIESVNPPESTVTNDSGENTDPFENLENTISQQESDYNSLLELENMEDLNVSTDASTQNPAPSQPPSNVEESQDELGNRKVENETGTLYNTTGGKIYYENKENGKIYNVDNGLQESNAHEGLISETRNGDTQYYTSMIDKGEEIYRGKNVTTEVNTSEHAKHYQDNIGQSKEPNNIGNPQTSNTDGQGAADAAAKARAAAQAKEQERKQQALAEANRGKTRGATPGSRGASGGVTNSSPLADDNRKFAENATNR